MTDAKGPPSARESARTRRRWGRRLRVLAKRTAFFGAGSTVMVAAFASVPTPVPGLGLILFVVALYLLAHGSKTARRAVAWVLRRLPMLACGLERVKPRLPRRIREFIDHNASCPRA